MPRLFAKSDPCPLDVVSTLLNLQFRLSATSHIDLFAPLFLLDRGCPARSCRRIAIAIVSPERVMATRNRRANQSNRSMT